MEEVMWQAIESAPRDGTEILVRCKYTDARDLILVAHWACANGDCGPAFSGWFYWHAGSYTTLEPLSPTSWQGIAEKNNDVAAKLAEEVERLKGEVERLTLYERAVASLAKQFVHPKTTAEEMARDILKGEE